MSIDFQAAIQEHLGQAVRYVADMAVFEQNHSLVYFCVTMYLPIGNKVSVIVTRGIREWSYTINLAGRTIDAALLEQLHNEVTAWFTAIKEGVSA